MTSEELMRWVANAFGQADVRPLFEALHHEIVWKSASKTRGALRFGGEYRSAKGVQEVLSKVLTTYVFKRFDAKEIVSKGGTVWGLFNVEVNYLPPVAASFPPQKIALEMAVRWRLKDGKIIEHQAFFDTATLLVEQCGITTSH